MKKIILLSTLLIVGCATKPVISPKPTVYFDGMSEEIFKEKNDALEVVEQTKDGIVYLRKECSECNPQYYVFMYGNLEAVSSFHMKLDKIKFDITPPSKTSVDSTDTN